MKELQKALRELLAQRSALANSLTNREGSRFGIFQVEGINKAIVDTDKVINDVTQKIAALAQNDK